MTQPTCVGSRYRHATYGRRSGRWNGVAAGFRMAIGIWLSAVALLAVSACEEVVPESDGNGSMKPPDDHGNTRSRATLVTAGTPISGRLERAADVDYFKVAVDEDSVRIIAATDAGAAVTPVVVIEDLDQAASNAGHVAWGDLPSPRPRHVHIRVTGDRRLRYTLAVSLVAAADPLLGDVFDIELRYLGTPPSATQRRAFEAAARFWEQAIAGGLPDLPIPTSQWKCREDDPSLFGEYVDDLLIFVRVEEIGDPAWAAAQSTICARRAEVDGGLPFIGAMTFNAADMEALETHSYLQRLAMRQIALVLGFGLLWDEAQFALLEHPSVGPDGSPVPDRDTHFSGALARAAFATVGGGYSGATVPVENDTGEYGSGALDLHWRESVFGTELMTTVLDSADAPVSNVTLASLADLGYEVDYTKAEPYALPTAAAPDGGSAALHLVGYALQPPAIKVALLPARLVQFLNGPSMR